VSFNPKIQVITICWLFSEGLFFGPSCSFDVKGQDHHATRTCTFDVLLFRSRRYMGSNQCRLNQDWSRGLWPNSRRKKDPKWLSALKTSQDMCNRHTGYRPMVFSLNFGDKNRKLSSSSPIVNDVRSPHFITTISTSPVGFLWWVETRDCFGYTMLVNISTLAGALFAYFSDRFPPAMLTLFLFFCLQCIQFASLSVTHVIILYRGCL